MTGVISLSESTKSCDCEGYETVAKYKARSRKYENYEFPTEFGVNVVVGRDDRILRFFSILQTGEMVSETYFFARKTYIIALNYYNYTFLWLKCYHRKI